MPQAEVLAAVVGGDAGEGEAKVIGVPFPVEWLT